MEIHKMHDGLWVISNIHFDVNDVFCGRPYVSLRVHKEETSYGWPANSFGIAIHDNDDYDVGLIYETDDEHFEDVLHGLVNWMRDHEQGVSYHNIMYSDTFNFFPDLGCKRERW